MAKPKRLATYSMEIEAEMSERKRALDRIGFERSEWDQLNWYVEYANKDVANLSAGEKLNLDIELSAVLEKLAGYPRPKQPTQVISLQQRVKDHLTDLVERRITTYGPCEILLTVVVDAVEEKDRKGRWIPRLVPRSDQMITPLRSSRQEGFDEQYLMVHLIKLLGRLGGMIRRCPHCSKIFLQFRRHAEFCSRSCQSIQFVQDKRRDIKQAGVQANKSVKDKNGKTKSIKEDRHGKSRR